MSSNNNCSKMPENLPKYKISGGLLGIFSRPKKLSIAFAGPRSQIIGARSEEFNKMNETIQRIGSGLKAILKESDCLPSQTRLVSSDLTFVEQTLRSITSWQPKEARFITEFELPKSLNRKDVKKVLTGVFGGIKEKKSQKITTDSATSPPLQKSHCGGSGINDLEARPV